MTLDTLRYGETGRRRLAWVVTVPAWGNWLITLIASVLGVTGLEYTRGDMANNAVAALLQLGGGAALAGGRGRVGVGAGREAVTGVSAACAATGGCARPRPGRHLARRR